MTHTLTLEIPEQVYEPLVKAAERSGRTPEYVALEYLANEVARFENDPLERFIGTLDSGITEWANKHDEYIGRALMNEMAPTEAEAGPDE